MKQTSPSHGVQLSARSIPTRIFRPNESLVDFVIEHIGTSDLREGMILAVTSKIVSLAEGRVISRSKVPEKQALVRAEADVYLGEIGYGCSLTVKHGLMIAAAGIDESNSETGDYILFPKDPFLSARNLWSALRDHYRLQNLGILMTDSHTTPLRRGVTGISLAHWGFRGLNDLVGSPDLFGRKLKMTAINTADALAATAVWTMGEGAEAQPLALIEASGIDFAAEISPTELGIPLEDDLYYPLLAPLIERKKNS